MDAIEDGTNKKFCEIKLGSNVKEDQEKKTHKLKKSPKCSKNAYYYFQSFSDSASIDGLKFLGEEGRPLSERIFWSIVISVAILLSIILVFQTFVKWMNSPVIVTFATTQKPIHEIPFPAITICPESKARKSEVNYTDIYLKKDNNEELTPFEAYAFDTLSIICAPDDEMVNKSANFTDLDGINLLSSVALNIHDFVIDVNWKGVDFFDIESAFVPILTGEGVCYTFNSLDKDEIFSDDVYYPDGFFKSNMNESEWTIEKGYNKDADANAYPRRTFIAGIKGGLSITLRGRFSNLDYVCGDALQGFKIALHHPSEIPRVKQNYFRVPINQVVVVGVKPNIMTTADELNHYAPDDRQCYFEQEKKLKFFKIYNQRNCLLECLTNYTLYACDCVDFHMPKENSTLICGIASQECTEDAKVRFLTGEVSKKIQKYGNTLRSDVPQDLEEFETNFDDQCDCLPSCHSIDFDVETSQSDWNWSEVLRVLRETNDWSEEKELFYKELDVYISKLMIYFKDMQFITSERNELYGYTDFWANVGGIIGLFTGFSFITMFEILYYLSLRLTCNIKMFGRRFWSGSPKVLDDPLYNSDDE